MIRNSKGQFVKGTTIMIGRHQSEASKEKNRLWHLGKYDDEKNPAWKGDNAGYIALHIWIKAKLGKPIKCTNPKCVYPKKTLANKILIAPKMFVWANISGEYKRDLNDYRQLCQSCNKKDGIRIHERFNIGRATA